MGKSVDVPDGRRIEVRVSTARDQTKFVCDVIECEDGSEKDGEIGHSFISTDGLAVFLKGVFAANPKASVILTDENGPGNFYVSIVEDGPERYYGRGFRGLVNKGHVAAFVTGAFWKYDIDQL